MTRPRDVFGRALVPLLTAEESAAADREARERAGVPERVLMENAGRSAALVLGHIAPSGRVLVLAGAGHNGGDGLVLARTLRAWGRDVEVVAIGSQPPDAALAHGFPLDVRDDDATDTLAAADVIVDAMLGTGARGAPRGGAAAWIEAANGSERPIVALDLPSGVDGTTGRIEGEAIRAVATVTFGWPKIGLLLHPARACCGRLIAVEIGFPPLDAIAAHGALAVTPAWAAARLRERPPDAHKGSAGSLLVLAGHHGMAGAAALAGESARRAGAGHVRIATVEANRAIVQMLVPEATFLDRDRLAETDLRGITGVVAGPGLGTDPDARDALAAALDVTGTSPVLLDADAINLLAREPEALHALCAARPVVLTPHPGEMGRLLHMATDEVTADAPAAARLAAERFGCAVLLKGQPSLVASPGQPLLVNTTGSSDVAAAGMGDQLAGIIGALLASGMGARDAAAAGLFYGSRAADLAALGRSLGPRDVAANLHLAFTDPGATASPSGFDFVTFDQPQRW